MTTNNLWLIANAFNQDALRIARELRGLQKTELAALLEISPSAITQFESGVIRPNVNTVKKMSLVLGFPATFFAEKNIEIFATDQCNFRKMESSSQIERRKMLAVGTMVGRFIGLIEQFIELPEEQVTPFIGARAVYDEDIELAASALRRGWGLGDGPIGNLVDLLESKGIVVLRLLEDCRRVDAFSLWYQQRPVIFLSTQKGSASRSRFDAAHELGHLILHSDCIPGDRIHERQADAFASAFLLPRAGFEQECPSRLAWPHFIAVKERWGVSLLALIRRARDLGKISEHTYKRAHIQYNQSEFKNNEPAEPPLEWPTSLPQAIQVLKTIGWTEEKLAGHLAVSVQDLHTWIYADADAKSRDPEDAGNADWGTQKAEANDSTTIPFQFFKKEGLLSSAPPTRDTITDEELHIAAIQRLQQLESADMKTNKFVNFPGYSQAVINQINAEANRLLAQKREPRQKEL